MKGQSRTEQRLWDRVPFRCEEDEKRRRTDSSCTKFRGETLTPYSPEYLVRSKRYFVPFYCFPCLLSHEDNNLVTTDGHGGDAASISLAQLMPSLYSVELAASKSTGLRDALKSAYDIACNTYRQGCDDEGGLCIADYDPREGIVIAGTGASDVVAGSTVAMSCLSVAEDGADVLDVLNCGDSRTLAFGRPRGGSSKDSYVHFSTRDHSPSCELEIERLAAGKDLGYSQPECMMSRWRVKVGDYNYGLARSLEGTFATSKGIVSDPDLSTVNLSEMLAERELCSIVLCTDGLFEVIDNEQAGRDVIQWRDDGLNADEVATKLCRKAVELGSPDNVSVVVLYLS